MKRRKRGQGKVNKPISNFQRKYIKKIVNRLVSKSSSLRKRLNTKCRHSSGYVFVGSDFLRLAPNGLTWDGRVPNKTEKRKAQRINFYARRIRIKPTKMIKK